MAKKAAAPKAAPKPKKLSPAEKQARVDQLQDQRLSVVVASYERVVRQLSSIYGGKFTDEFQRLAAELAAVESALKAVENT